MLSHSSSWTASLLLCLLVLPALSAGHAHADDGQVWAALKQGGKVILLRHTYVDIQEGIGHLAPGNCARIGQREYRFCVNRLTQRFSNNRNYWCWNLSRIDGTSMSARPLHAILVGAVVLSTIASVPSFAFEKAEYDVQELYKQCGYKGILDKTFCLEFVSFAARQVFTNGLALKQ